MLAKQLSLWPTQEEASVVPIIWENLEKQQQDRIITSLAKLINKIVCPQQSPQSREVNNER